MLTFDGNWRPSFCDLVAAERTFAWWPKRLWNNQYAWLRHVYRITAYKHQYLRDGPDWTVHYSLTLPVNSA